MTTQKTMDALLDGLKLMMVDGVQPKSMEFDTRTYLTLASELGIDDPGAAPRAATVQHTYFKDGVECGPGENYTQTKFHLKEVRVGDSFQLRAFGVLITIKLGEKAE